jgi:hypothetical protein
MHAVGGQLVSSIRSAGRSESGTRYAPLSPCRVQSMMRKVDLSFTFPAILTAAQRVPSHPELANVRHFPHAKYTPYASRKVQGCQCSELARSAVQHAEQPRSSTDSSSCPANGQASIPHLTVLAPVPRQALLDKTWHACSLGCHGGTTVMQRKRDWGRRLGTCSFICIVHD